MIAKEDVRPGVMVRRKGDGYHYDDAYEIIGFADSPEHMEERARREARPYRRGDRGLDQVLLWKYVKGKRYTMCIDSRRHLELIQ